MTSANVTPHRYWHQGFGTIHYQGIVVVPFVTRETAERIAAQAVKRSGEPIRVLPVHNGWGFAQEVAS